MNDYTITSEQVYQFANGIKGMPAIAVPATFTIRDAEDVVDVFKFISINLSRMYCGSKALEMPARKNMAAMARMIQSLNSEK